jgi:hypothetical protein
VGHHPTGRQCCCARFGASYALRWALDVLLILLRWCFGIHCTIRREDITVKNTRESPHRLPTRCLIPFTVLCAVQTVLMHIIFPCEILFSFCPSTCSKQSSCADQKDLAQLFKAASVELLSSSGVSESPRRSTNSLSFEGTEEQGLKRITSICGPSTWPPQKHTMFLFCHRFSVGPDFGPTILGPGHARSSLVLLLRILTICGTALGQLPTQDTPAGVC